MRSKLDVLFGRVEDPVLRADIQSQVERLHAKRTFGLVFESHLPERIRLPEHPIRVGVKVAYRDDPDIPAYEVPAIKGKAVTLSKVRNADGSSFRRSRRQREVGNSLNFTNRQNAKKHAALASIGQKRRNSLIGSFAGEF